MEKTERGNEEQNAARFSPRVTSFEIATLQQAAVLINTKSWAVNDWSVYRSQQGPTDSPSCLLTMSELNQWLCRFVVEVCRKDGKHYSPTPYTSFVVVFFVGYVLPWMFSNPEFDGFRKTLDAEMKRLR